MQLCRFIRQDILEPLKDLIDQFVNDGVSCPRLLLRICWRADYSDIRMAELSRCQLTSFTIGYQQMQFLQLICKKFFAKVDKLGYIYIIGLSSTKISTSFKHDNSEDHHTVGIFIFLV